MKSKHKRHIIPYVGSIIMMIAASCGKLMGEKPIGGGNGFVSTHWSKENTCNIIYATSSVPEPHVANEHCWYLFDNLKDFESGDPIKARIILSCWKCRDNVTDHIGHHLSNITLQNIPGFKNLQIPTERWHGDIYLSGCKAVSTVTLNAYSFTDNFLDIDILITMYQESDGEIHIVYKGPVHFLR